MNTDTDLAEIRDEVWATRVRVRQQRRDAAARDAMNAYLDDGRMNPDLAAKYEDAQRSLEKAIWQDVG